MAKLTRKPLTSFRCAGLRWLACEATITRDGARLDRAAFRCDDAPGLVLVYIGRDPSEATAPNVSRTTTITHEASGLSIGGGEYASPQAAAKRLPAVLAVGIDWTRTAADFARAGLSQDQSDRLQAALNGWPADPYAPRPVVTLRTGETTLAAVLAMLAEITSAARIDGVTTMAPVLASARVLRSYLRQLPADLAHGVETGMNSRGYWIEVEAGPSWARLYLHGAAGAEVSAWSEAPEDCDYAATAPGLTLARPCDPLDPAEPVTLAEAEHAEVLAALAVVGERPDYAPVPTPILDTEPFVLDDADRLAVALLDDCDDEDPLQGYDPSIPATRAVLYRATRAALDCDDMAMLARCAALLPSDSPAARRLQESCDFLLRSLAA